MKHILKDNELVLQAETDLVASQVKEFIDKVKGYVEGTNEYSAITLDMTSVKSIDSVGVTFVIGLFKTAESKEKRFKVIGLNPDISGLFRLMKLDEIFTIA